MTGNTFHGPAGQQAGDHNVQHNHFRLTGPREPAGWPHRVGPVPRRAAAFQCRGEAARLRRVVAGGGTAVLSQVLTGTGGVGKTQLAADFAHEVWERGEVDVLVWVTAASRDAVVSRFAQAGVELCRADPGDPERAATAFLGWLAARPGGDGPRWMVVLDDLAELRDLDGLWPPDNPRGRTLVTTRRRDAALTAGRTLVTVGVYTRQESVAYLTDALTFHGCSTPADEIASLARDLGDLPLALAQAVAFITDTGLDVPAYRARLADHTTRLTALLPENGSLPDEQRHTVAALWDLSIDRADHARPAGLARPLLDLLAQLDPNGIPQAVLTTPPALTHLTTTRTSDGTGETSAEEVNLALRVLHRLGLADHHPANPHSSGRVHQLLQRAVRDQHTSDQRRALSRTAADALDAAWPAIERDTTLGELLRANTTTLTHHAQVNLIQPQPHRVLFRAAHSLGESGQVAAARDYHHQLSTEFLATLGSDHPDTLLARHNLAYWRAEAGDPAGAAAAYAELLTDHERILGPDHPNTLTTRSNLASCSGAAGDPADAAAAYTELLTDQLRILGPDHPDTLITRGNLAACRGEAGDPAGAAAAYAELLTDRKRILGPDHPNTLTTSRNLAYWREQAT